MLFRIFGDMKGLNFNRQACFKEVKGMKNKFTKWAIVMSAVLVLVSAIPVVGAACLFCDEPIEEQETVVVVDPVVDPEPIPNTDAE